MQTNQQTETPQLLDDPHRRVAYHEAGHLTVAMMRGEKIYSSYVKAYSKTNEAVGGTYIKNPRLPTRVAGKIAELLVSEPNITPADIIGRWKAGQYELDFHLDDVGPYPVMMSDREAVRAVEVALGILRKYRHIFDKLARYFVDHGKATFIMPDDLALICRES